LFTNVVKGTVAAAVVGGKAEAGLANAMVRANGVDAVGLQRAGMARELDALVDVLASPSS
jgi:hypothetical protein